MKNYTGGSPDRIFIYADTLDDPVLVEVSGQDYYYLKDSLHSVKAILDGSAVLIESYDYSPFGLMTISDDRGTDITTSTIGNPFGYTGRRWDVDSGLWYYRNRMYSAELGRFMQRDPAGYVDGLNLYAYCKNAPLNYTDPDGLVARETWNSIDPTLSGIKESLSDYINERGQENYEQGNYIAAAIDAVGSAMIEGAPENKVELAVEAGLSLLGLKAAKYLDSLSDLSRYVDDAVDGVKDIDNVVTGKLRVGSANKLPDGQHGFNDIIDNYVGGAAKFDIPTKGPGGKIVRTSELRQIEGSNNGVDGIFEWIVDQGNVTHRRFIPGGKITGYPNQIPK